MILIANRLIVLVNVAQNMYRLFLNLMKKRMKDKVNEKSQCPLNASNNKQGNVGQLNSRIIDVPYLWGCFIDSWWQNGRTSINTRANKAYVLNYPYVTKFYTMLFNENIISILQPSEILEYCNMLNFWCHKFMTEALVDVYDDFKKLKGRFLSLTN